MSGERWGKLLSSCVLKSTIDSLTDPTIANDDAFMVLTTVMQKTWRREEEGRELWNDRTVPEVMQNYLQRSADFRPRPVVIIFPCAFSGER